MAPTYPPRFEVCMRRVRGHEKGVNTDPRDPGNRNGGGTYYGVTLFSLADYYAFKKIRREPTLKDLFALTFDQIDELYYNLYWLPAGCNFMPVGMDYQAFDTAVVQGVPRTKRWTQAAVGVKADGVFGPQTKAALQGARVQVALNLFAQSRRNQFLNEPTRAAATEERFENGWIDRLIDVFQISVLEAAGIDVVDSGL